MIVGFRYLGDFAPPPRNRSNKSIIFSKFTKVIMSVLISKNSFIINQNKDYNSRVFFKLFCTFVLQKNKNYEKNISIYYSQYDCAFGQCSEIID